MDVWSSTPEKRPKPVNHDLVRSLEKLRRLSPSELGRRYQEWFGEPARSLNKQFLFRRLAWQLQVRAEGALSERARRRAEEIALDSDLGSGSEKAHWSWPRGEASAASARRPSTRQRDERLPEPGALLNRRYRDAEVIVKVLPHGFEYQTRHYCSLSAIAREVTGTRWNGLLFFGLTERRHA
jgi:Protein of unknown function (DUF2924)